MTEPELDFDDLDDGESNDSWAQAAGVDGLEEDEALTVDVPPPGIVIEKNDRSLSEFHRWYQSGRLILNPDWQRRYVWKNPRASRLIESMLIDIPVPVIYLAKQDDGKYVVIDGQQRLTSVFRFFEGSLRLRGLQMRREYEGKRFVDLPVALQNHLYDYTLRTFELAPQTSPDLMFVLFERLNTGGVALNEMEIRNSIFRGPLNDLIKRLAQNEDFLATLSQDNLSERMLDRSLVLRFLAFYERTHLKSRSGLKRFLNEFLETYRTCSDEKLKEFEEVFKKCMKASVSIFGDSGFRLFRSSDGASGEWATRPNAAIFQAVATSFANYDLGQLTRSADAISEEYVDMIASDERWRDYVRRANGEATRVEYVFDTWRERLRMACIGVAPNDSVRLFSRRLKLEMFQANPACAICGNEVRLINDAVLDHTAQYWRGGQTVPENARLTHRFCNNVRSR